MIYLLRRSFALLVLLTPFSAFAGDHFRIFFVNETDNRLHLTDSTDDCMYGMAEFHSSYIKPTDDTGEPKKYELETKKSGGCFFKHSSYSFHTKLVTKVNIGGKIQEHDIELFKVYGNSSGADNLAKAKNINTANMETYGLCLETKETLQKTKDPIYWFKVQKSPCED
ncbi:hypothetical protein ABXV22_25700 [Vibrio rotiferianus]|uniref:hypothetical protein n=1 Tax=Vibrio rotiferianus TaxID=190895 RepID=UPI0033929EA3